ncbi:hypothetical protein F5884DRAFT_768600 [Xylogone sp. PMI_703]|nr:hypothetical protein F5884DRAFT_768600 [Xylogone sp. PMI_703]
MASRNPIRVHKMASILLQKHCITRVQPIQTPLFARASKLSTLCGRQHQYRYFSKSRECSKDRPLGTPKPSAPRKSEVTIPDIENLPPRKDEEDPGDEGEPSTNTNTGKLVIGGIILFCCGITSWCLKSTYSSRSGAENVPQRRNQIFEDHFVLSKRNVYEGRWWTLVTSSFAHTSISHLMVNMFCLWSVGPVLYSVIGPAKFAILYLGSAATGSAFQLSWWSHEKIPAWAGAVGASGSLAGVFTFTAGLWPNTGVNLLFFIPMRLWQGIAAFAGFSVVSLAEGWFPRLGHADHLGGMAFGAAYIAYLLSRARKGKPFHRRLMR